MYGTRSELNSTLNYTTLPPRDKQWYNNWYRYNRQHYSDGVSKIVPCLQGRRQGGGIIVPPIQGWHTGWGIHVPSTLSHKRKHDGGSTHPRRRLWQVFGMRNRKEIFLWTIYWFHASKVPRGWWQKNEQKKKNLMFVAVPNYKRYIGGVLMNIPSTSFTEKEDTFVDMSILVVWHYMIITIGMYRWWAAWLGEHQREGGVMIYQGDNMCWECISNVVSPEEIYHPTWISINETNAPPSI